MDRPIVICAGCRNTVEYCLEYKICEDFPESESYGHDTNRWSEECMRFFGTDNVVRWLKFWHILK